MARVSILIDKAELTKAIDEAEASNTFKNESALFQFICKSSWAQTIKDALGRKRELTPALLYSRVKEFSIPLKTVKGKKGNPNLGVKLTGEEKAKKIKDRPGYLNSVQAIKRDITNHYKAIDGKDFKNIPEARQNLLNKHAKGNLRSLIKTKCLECCCWEASEAAQCKVYGCPLYLANPFLKAKNLAEETLA